MQSTTRSTLAKYFKEIGKFKLSGFVIFVCIIGGAAIGATIPIFVKKLLDTLTVPGVDKQHLYAILFQIALLNAIGWVFWRTATFVSDYFQTTILANLTNSCFAYLHKHSFSFFNNNFVGSLVKRVNYFTRAFESLMDQFFWSILPLVVDFSIILFVLFKTSSSIGALVSVWIVAFFIVNWFFTNYKMKFEIERNELETKTSGILADTITNQSNVKLFVGYNYELKKFAKAVEKVRKLRRFSWDLNAIFEAVQALLMTALNIGTLYIAIQLYTKNKLTVGDFVLLQTYLIMIFDRVWGIGRVIRAIYTDLADANEMTIMLDTPHEIKDVPRAATLKVTEGVIEFKNVDFYYHETRKIFSKFNLAISAKEKIALVGPSGAGKSTVIKLLMRMHDVSKGEINIDNQRISHVSQESLWDNISLVPQDPMLFHRTLMENIRYGKSDATDKEVIAAAKLAHCHEFISNFPDEYKTYVGERGVKLSGGERQRVAIARAILRNAPILVLDEATSSLDSESEHLIQDALEKLMQNKTVIVIAHRLSTIMKMDRIVVVDKGKVIESGSHEELLKKKSGMYKDLWRLQAGGFMSDKPAETQEVQLAEEID